MIPWRGGLAAALGAALTVSAAVAEPLSYGPRPAYLIGEMTPSPLKDRLQACLGQSPKRSRFSIGHRGAPLFFPEHTDTSYRAAAQMGAGLLECDVTFTQDHELVCRHAQNDLHTTTDILVTDLAGTCTAPFQPATGTAAATAECRASDITLDEFLSLTPKMDAADAAATTVEDYVRGGVAPWRSTLYASGQARVMTHGESIALIDALGADFTPELKSPVVPMPHNGFTQADYAQKLIDEYKAAGIDPSRVWPQSFNLSDIQYWIEAEPAFGAQAVYLIDHYRDRAWDPMAPDSWPRPLSDYTEMGVQYVAPPLWVLVTLDDAGQIIPSAWAEAANAAGLKIIAWTLERSGPLSGGGDWYYRSIAGATENDGVTFDLLHVLAQDVGVVGVFSDWPATTTFYANCFGID